jgi:hypothetical protein
VEAPAAYPWSSAAAHCDDAARRDAALDMQPWRRTWTTVACACEEADAIRRNTHTGRPLGALDFVCALEKALRRRLGPLKGGRPPKQDRDARQQDFSFGQS